MASPTRVIPIMVKAVPAMNPASPASWEISTAAWVATPLDMRGLGADALRRETLDADKAGRAEAILAALETVS